MEFGEHIKLVTDADEWRGLPVVAKSCDMRDRFIIAFKGSVYLTLRWALKDQSAKLSK